MHSNLKATPTYQRGTPQDTASVRMLHFCGFIVPRECVLVGCVYSKNKEIQGIYRQQLTMRCPKHHLLQLNTERTAV